MDQSKTIGLKNRIWRRLSKTLSQESVVQAAKTIQRAAALFFSCGTKRYDTETVVPTSGVPHIWKSGVTHGEIMEYYKKKIVIFEDEPIIPIGGDGFPGKKNRDLAGEKEHEPTEMLDQEKHEAAAEGVTNKVQKPVADITHGIEDDRLQGKCRESQVKRLTHTERWANRIDHTKCCLGWDFIYGRRDCAGKDCQKGSNTYLQDTTGSFLSNLDESDLSNPFILDLIKERLAAGGISATATGDGIDLSEIQETDLSNPFLLDVIKEGGGF